MSSSTSKAWIVAASIGAVEALKDQGVCRWNHTIRSIHQHAKSKIKATTTAQTNTRSNNGNNKKFSSSATAAISSKVREGKMKQREESFRTVMYLSSWGPC